VVFIVRWCVVVFLILVSLATWVPGIRIAGVGPDLLLGVVFVFALRRGVIWGVWAGFVVGLLVAAEDPILMGIESAALILAGFGVARGSKSLDRTNPVVLIVLLFGAALLTETVRALWISGKQGGSFPVLWLRWALPGTLYTTLALPVLAWFVSSILGRRDWLSSAP
jgi:rod shape-determining protein MreD